MRLEDAAYYIYKFYENDFERQKNADIALIRREIAGIYLPQPHIVLDFETTGLDPYFDEIVSWGLFYSNTALVAVRLNDSEDSHNVLIESLKNMIRNLNSKQAPKLQLWAFYSAFEAKWLSEVVYNNRLEWPFELRELKQMRGRLTDILPLPFDDPITGRNVPLVWRKFTRTGDLAYLSLIVHHNYADIVREAILWALLKNKAFKDFFADGDYIIYYDEDEELEG
ncbi:hypothetical protein E3E31_12015 [Thermococcus sp. M39]|uniref:ribonuclease H-like domain-containing protein n=1 Tax=Thermococcus sp. M39 TaxID=1638262 RepID=UPI001439871B|nr:ribonuclease H-like domain-containing protein [Thermococcus sp. M39]NJE09233.1 hypothetical protein [Thermococcus sp. M39]